MALILHLSFLSFHTTAPQPIMFISHGWWRFPQFLGFSVSFSLCYLEAPNHHFLQSHVLPGVVLLYAITLFCMILLLFCYFWLVFYLYCIFSSSNFSLIVLCDRGCSFYDITSYEVLSEINEAPNWSSQIRKDLHNSSFLSSKFLFIFSFLSLHYESNDTISIFYMIESMALLVDFMVFLRKTWFWFLFGSI